MKYLLKIAAITVEVEAVTVTDGELEDLFISLLQYVLLFDAEIKYEPVTFMVTLDVTLK